MKIFYWEDGWESMEFVFLKDYAFFDWLYFSFMKPLGLFIKWLLAMEFDIFETSFLIYLKHYSTTKKDRIFLFLLNKTFSTVHTPNVYVFSVCYKVKNRR